MTGVAGALDWIVGLLEDAGIPFQVVGGLAARAYGATRPLADIDLYVPSAALRRVATLAAPYVTKAPRPHRDAHWDLTFMKLAHGGYQIEIAGADDAMLFDGRTDTWVSAAIVFEHPCTRDVAGVRLPLMPIAQLLEYKRALGREVDVADVAQMEACGDVARDA